MRRAASSLLLALASSACLHCATAAPAPSPEDRPADEQHGRRLRLPEFRSVYPKTPEEKQEMQALAEKGHKFGREFYDMEQTGDAISRDELDAQISPDDFERAAAWCAFAEKDYLGIDEDERVLDKTLPQRPQRAGDYLLLGRLARAFVRCARYKADTFETCSFTHVGQAYFETLALSLTGSHAGLKCAGPLPPRRKINLLGPDAKTQVPLDEIVQGWYEEHRKHEPGELPPITPWRPPCVVSPFVPKERFCGDDLPATGYTQFGILRLAILGLLLNTAVDDGIEGSFVEVGSWRGGASIFARAMFDYALKGARHRRVHLFDSWKRMEGYGEDAEDDEGAQRTQPRGWASYFNSASEESVKASFKLFGLYDPDRVRLHAGDFNKTTMEFGRYEDALIGAPTIAVLLIDGTFHDSYVAALHNLYERVPVGGFVILGDAYHPDVHRAWSDFARDQKITDELVRIDRLSAYVRKTAAVKIDKTKARYRGEYKLTAPMLAPDLPHSAYQHGTGVKARPSKKAPPKTWG